MDFAEYFKYSVSFYFSHYIIVLISLICLAATIHINPKIGKKDIRNIILLPVIIFILSITDCTDYCLAAMGTGADGFANYPVYIRQVCAVLSYILRPSIGAAALFIIWPDKFKKYRWIILIPFAINTLVYGRCLFPNGFFRINEQNGWERPYSNVSFLTNFGYVSYFLYGSMMIAIIVKDILNRRFIDSISVFVTLISCFFGFYFESMFDILGLGPSIAAAGSLSYFIFIMVKYIRVDPLTNVYNRHDYYSIVEKYDKIITGIISLDMNNLKETNDEYGHAAGDKALETIGDALIKNSNRSIIPFRSGGDEFLLVCLKMTEQEIEKVVESLNDDLNNKTTVSVAVGYSYRNEKESVESLLARADAFMYKIKRLMKI